MNRWKVAAVLLLGVAACNGPLPAKGDAGGPVSGAADTHCQLADGGMRAQDTWAWSCHPGPNVDGGSEGPTLGATLYNASGSDDDCKYQVEFTSTPVYRQESVFLTVIVKNQSDGAVAAGANLAAEVFLSETHPAPNSNQTTVEDPAGTYKVGPIRFDASGRWTVRFHLFEDCSDRLENSPHGHVAFFLDVP